MKKVLILVGLPASGKSTFAKQLMLNEPGKWKRFNKDELRACFDFSEYSSKNEEFVNKIISIGMNKALLSDYNIIYDNTSFASYVYKSICEMAQRIGDIMVEEKIFEVDIDECIRRDSLRDGNAMVGEKVIRDMYERYSLKKGYPKPKSIYFDPIKIESQEPIIPVVTDINKPKAVISDIDGTLSLFNSIRKDGSIDIRFPGAIIRNPYDASRADQDTPNKAVIAVLEQMYKAGYKILLCSGRKEKYRTQTESFLKQHTSFEYQLFMRKDNDGRGDEIVKREIYNDNIRDKYNVLFVMDDRLKVCKLWHELGLMLFRIGDPCNEF